MYVHTHIHTYTHTYTHVHTNLPTHAHTHTHTHTHTYTYTYTHTHKHKHIESNFDSSGITAHIWNVISELLYLLLEVLNSRIPTLLLPLFDPRTLTQTPSPPHSLGSLLQQEVQFISPSTLPTKTPEEEEKNQLRKFDNWLPYKSYFIDISIKLIYLYIA